MLSNAEIISKETKNKKNKEEAVNMCDIDPLRIIFERRSTRSFTTEQIKDNELDIIIKAAKFAPSAMNQQLWHFTVVQNKELLARINSLTRNAFEKSGNPRYEERARADNFSPFHNAPTYIIVTVDEKAIAPQADGALALGNAFLAAEALGIGSCWIHAVNYLYTTVEGKELFKELGVPEGYVPIGSGAFGYAAGPKPDPAPRRDGTVSIIK
ncbi:FMN reductase [Ruminiclostridium hungatei]|uniref:FMN reductase n=1 Tax=Ruminiclostridium hungatei TaxID=48256 RepID=A0A1V4SJC1_RUMHU|nr:nitroreductase [Ruminiclostridium hungatei]OPX43992.1 FMN reductase [Ruminiclostridium hungatei]